VFAESPDTRTFWNRVHEDIETGFPLVRDGKVIVSWLDGHVTRETVEELIKTIDGVPFYYWSATKMPDPSGGGHVGWSATEYFP
jgi:prepilin-type processing-associated H-X9-DG protein